MKWKTKPNTKNSYTCDRKVAKACVRNGFMHINHFLVSGNTGKNVGFLFLRRLSFVSKREISIIRLQTCTAKTMKHAC